MSCIAWGSKSDLFCNGFFLEPFWGATLRLEHLASRYAVLEAEWLLPRAVTIVRNTSATSSSQSLMKQSVCIIGNPNEAW